MKRTTRIGWVLAVAAAVVVGGLTLPSMAYAAAPTYNVMSLSGSGRLGDGTRVSDPAAEMYFFGTSTYVNQSDSFVDGGHMDVQIQPPTGTTLTPGTYATSRFPDATHAGLDISADSMGCSSVAGSLTISEVQLDAGTGAVTAFAASYSGYGCLAGEAPYSGQLRWNSTLDYAVADVSPGYLNLGNADEFSVGPAKVVTVTNRGPASLTGSGPATVTGEDAADFVVVNDGCDGTALAVGQSCTVSVAAQPTALGDRRAVVLVPIGGTQTAGAGLLANGVEPAAGLYSPLSRTARILDTRVGTGAPKGPVGMGRTLALQVTGHAGVPTHSVAAVVLNLTVTGPTAGGYVTAYPAGVARPNASTINFPRGWTGANSVTVPVGTNGRVNLYNCCGSVNLIADIVGWYAKDDAARTVANFYPFGFHLAQPQRLLDTRTWGYGKLPSHYYAEIPIDYGSGSNPGTLAMTVTALSATGGGYVTVYMAGDDPSKTSTLNVRPGVITSNLAMGRLVGGSGTRRTFRVYNGSSKPLHLLVDAIGYYEPDSQPFGLRYRPITPKRIVDTRISFGAAPFGPATTRPVYVPDGVADDSTWAVMANLTAVKPTAQTFLTVWPDYSGAARPPVSTMNPGPGSTVANATIAEVGLGNDFNVYNASGTTNLAIDVSGTFEQFPPYGTPALQGAARASVKAAARLPRSAVGTTLTAPRPLAGR